MKMQYTRISVTLVLSLGLLTGGCVHFPAATPMPTLLPDAYIPTAIAMTANALVDETSFKEITPFVTGTPAPVLTELLTPSIEEVEKTDQPTPTKTKPSAVLPSSTPFPTSIPSLPFADIQILRPGELSKVASPIPFHAYLVPGADNRAQVALLGEDGRAIFRQIFVFSDSDFQKYLTADIEFEISGLAETARLVVQTQDSRGRILELSSADIILLSLGVSDINPAGDLLSSLFIESPNARSLIQGGTATISGWARVPPDQLLLVEIIASDGRVLGSRLAGLVSVADGSHNFFSIDVPYQISAPTWARISITERGIRFPGPLSVTSIEVLLSP